MLLIVRITLLLCISGGPILCRAETTCIPEFKHVDNASTLQGLLTIAEELPTAADKNVTVRQKEIRTLITTLRSSLRAYMEDYVDKYKGNEDTFCTRIYTIGAKAFQDGEDNLQRALAIDVAKQVRNEYAGKFKANINSIKKKIQGCGENCTETQEKTDLSEVKSEMLYTLNDWCESIRTKLRDVVQRAWNGELQAETGIEWADWWLKTWNCENKI